MANPKNTLEQIRNHWGPQLKIYIFNRIIFGKMALGAMPFRNHTP